MIILLKNIQKNLFGIALAFFILAGRFKGAQVFSQTPFDLTLILFLCVLFCGAPYILNENVKILNSPYFLGVCAFFGLILLACLSYFWCLSTSHFFYKIIRLVIFTCIPFLLAVCVFNKYPEQIKGFLITFSALCFCFLLFTAFEICFNNKPYNVLGNSYIGVNRVLGSFGLVLLVYLLFIQKKKSKLNVLLLILIFFINFWFMMASGGRGPLIAFIISSLLVLTLKTILAKSKKRVFLVNLGFIFLLIASLFVIPKSKLETIERIKSVFSSDNQNTASRRLIFLQNSIVFLKSSPILGHGLGSWAKLNKLNAERAHPHNIFAEVGVELGLFGLIFLSLCLLIFFLSPASLRNLMSQNTCFICLYFLALFSMLNSLVSGDLNDNRPLFLFLSSFTFFKPSFTK